MFGYDTLHTAMSLDWTFYLPALLMVIFLILGVNIWVVLGLGSILMLHLTEVLPLSLVGEAFFDSIDAFALLAVPLFILTGDVLVRSGLSNKLLDVAEATLGFTKAGLGNSSVLGCGFFACISGSDAADAAAIGRITIHRLEENGYPRAYASALIAAGACTGILIPPSIAYIIIGLVLGISASTLFLCAAIPGLMMLGSVLLTNAVMNRFMGYERNTTGFHFRHWLATCWDAKWALLVPFIILGGIYSGIFTPTESAAVAVAFSMAIGMIQGTIKLKDIPNMLEASAKLAGVIIPIIAMSHPLAQTLAALEVPQFFVSSITDVTANPIIIVMLMFVILMVAGCVMETTPNIVILSPLLLPLAQSIGMNELHFCIFMVTALGVGFITPPMGLNLFVVSSLTQTPVMSISKYAVPFVLVMIVTVLLIAFIPEISLWLL